MCVIEGERHRGHVSWKKRQLSSPLLAGTVCVCVCVIEGGGHRGHVSWKKR